MNPARFFSPFFGHFSRLFFWFFLFLSLTAQAATPTLSSSAPPSTASSASPASSPKNLNDLIQLATDKSESLKAVDQSILSLEAEIRARDLELSAVLSADLADSRDQRTSLSQQRIPGHTQLFKTTLAKPFSTGTSVSLLLSHQIADLTATGGDGNLANWELSISQDLWRNSFGRGIRLRQTSDTAELKSRRFQLLGQKQQLVIGIERIYWDLTLALKEEQVRLANIERSETLEKWIRDRVRKFAAESTDLLQVQALISQRKLELLENRNRIADLRVQIRQLIPLQEVEDFQPQLESLEESRSPLNLLALAATSASAKPWSLAALSSSYRSRQAQLEADRVEDQLRPSLQAYLSHGRNGIEDTFTQSWNRAQTEDFMATSLGLRFSMELDTDLKSDRRRAAQLAAEARELEARAQRRQGDLAWVDLERQIRNLKAQTEEAKKLTKFQLQKSNEEHRRYRQGRSTAFQAITFETEAAVSQLRYYQTLSNLRKLESLARGFAIWEEDNL